MGAKAETSGRMAYAEKKAADAVLRAARNGQSAGRRKPPQRPNGKHPERVKRQSTPLKNIGKTEGRKDTTGYSVSGGEGKITGTNDSGVAFSISNDATITYQPGYLEGNGYYLQDGAYNKSGVLLIPGPVTIYSEAKFHSGYLKFATSRGAMTLDGDKGQRGINFTAGSTPTVSAITKTKTVLVQTGSTATQNFAFEGMEDIE